ncbi:hypothetical protein [Paenibacillus thiaminolyticus]|nr:hypothetical protein [Paenibacillus thiaminolyticus]
MMDDDGEGTAMAMNMTRRGNPALVQQFTRYESILAEIAAKVHYFG